MSRRTPSSQPIARLRPTTPAAVSDRGDWKPTHWQLVGAGLLLVALWALVFAALSVVFAWGPWVWRALTITTAIVAVACVVRIIRPRRRALAGVCGALAGLACWVWWFTDTGRPVAWWHDPLAMIDEVRWLILVGAPPLETAGPLEDVLLLAVALTTTVTVLMLLGGEHPLFAGAFATLFLLIPPAATGGSVGWPTLAGAGVLLAFLAWIGSPSPNRTGIVAAVLAVAVAAGAMAVAPATRDRVWNDALLPSPFSDSVPDVTVALAEDLRRRSNSRAFTFTSSEPGPYRFTLATLSEFNRGRWRPQDDLNQENLVVSDPRSETLLPPEPIDTLPVPPAASVTVTIEGLFSGWLPLPQSTVRVVEAEEPSEFDPGQWQWTADANTARGERQITRRGNQYVAEMEEETLGTVRQRAFSVLPADATRLIAGPGDAPDELAPYLELPERLPGAIAEAAERVAGSADDRLAVGQALQNWFQGGEFTYDEAAPYQPGMDPDDPYQVMEALLTERRGFCVHFASTFAVMARYLGTPTRVAVGYAARAVDEEDTVVRGSELHAWPEIYVAGAGWVAFEPTPGGAGTRADGTDAENVEDLSSAPMPQATEESPQEDDSPSQTPPTQEEGSTTTEAEGSDATTTGTESPTLRTVTGWAAALVVVALLCTPAAGRWLRTRRRNRAIACGDRPATHAWKEFQDTAADLGLFESRSERPGPRAQTAEALVDHLEAQHTLTGEAAAAAHVLADRMTAERYGNGRPGAEPEREDGIDEFLRVAVGELRAGASRGARLRARLLPPSILPRP